VDLPRDRGASTHVPTPRVELPDFETAKLRVDDPVVANAERGVVLGLFDPVTAFISGRGGNDFDRDVGRDMDGAPGLRSLPRSEAYDIGEAPAVWLDSQLHARSENLAAAGLEVGREEEDQPPHDALVNDAGHLFLRDASVHELAGDVFVQRGPLVYRHRRVLCGDHRAPKIALAPTGLSRASPTFWHTVEQSILAAKSTCGTTCTGNAPVCLGGACVACSPKATQCSGAVPQTCDAAGAWQSGSVTAGLCGALCAPTAARCSGNNVQACGSDGRWQTTRNCPKCSGAGQCIPAVAVGAGGYHTCAALSDGTVACWGENQHGELGNGSTSTGPTSSPVAVSGLSGVTAVSLGDQHSCALVSSGAVECWGEGTNGELGNGAMTNSSNPVLASGLSGVVSVSVGLYYSSALLSNGTVQSWGNNGNGSLGNQPTALCPFGFSTCAWTPILLTNVSGVSAIAAGNSSQCALLSSGTVECWGFNGDGELGNGTTSNGSGTPVAVSNLSGAVGISSGDGHACARLSDGTVACWGANSSGQLGNGSTNESSVPVPVSSLSGVSATATGGHFSCALLSGGTVRCWGENVHGQLGNGPTTGLSMPVPVGVSSLSGATAIAAGYEHACALLSSGAVACWGYNGWGQLGNGLTADSSMPVTVTW